MHERLFAALHYVRSLGAGRVLVGVLVAVLLGGPALGLVATANLGGVRTAVADAIRAKNSDDDEDAGLLTPLSGVAGGDDGPDTSLSPVSTETPTMTGTQTATATATATALPSGTVQPTVTAQPTATPTLTVCPSSPNSPNAVSATSSCSPNTSDSPNSPDSPDSPS